MTVEFDAASYTATEGGADPESRHGDYTEMTVILPHTKKADADYDVGKTDS